MFKQIRKGKAVLLILVVMLLPLLFCNSSQANAAKSIMIKEVELNPQDNDYSGNEVFTNAPSGSELKVVFIDVGQGDSTLVMLPNGQTMLIDGGEPDKGDVVISTIREMNITRVDAIVATHPHADHIGGLITVMDKMPIGQV